MRQVLKKQRKHTKSGFTIIEISIATVFISILMIMISVIIINVVNIYQKGNTIKALNSVGRTLVDDLTKSIEAATPAKVIDDNNWKQYFQSNGDESVGVFCSGKYSYIWGDITLHTTSLGDKSGKKLLKVKDPYHEACKNYHNSTTSITGSLAKSDLEELLNDNEVGLKVYRFHVNKVHGSSEDEDAYINQYWGNPGEVFFSGYFVLGTDRGEKGQSDADTSLSNCKADSEDYDYCAINKFKFAARTAGKVY